MVDNNCNCELRDRQWNGFGKCLRCGHAYVDKRAAPREPLIVEVPTVLTRIDTQLKAPEPPKVPSPKPSKPDKGDEDLGNVVIAAVRAILANPETATAKRVAWAYGCLRAGSEEEAALLALLRTKLAV